MHQPRPKIPRRIDRVSCRPPKRKTDRDNQQRHRKCPNCPKINRINRRSGRLPRRSPKRENPENQHKCPNYFAKNIRRRAPHRRTRAKNGQLGRRIFTQSPVWKIRHPHKKRPKHRPAHLRRHINRHQPPLEMPPDCHSQTHRRIQMRPADPPKSKHRNKHRKPPPDSNRQPASILGFAPGQQHTRYNSIAQQDEKCGSEKLGKCGGHKRILLPPLPDRKFYFLEQSVVLLSETVSQDIPVLKRRLSSRC